MRGRAEPLRISPPSRSNSAKNSFAQEISSCDGGEIRNGSDLPRIARATKILELARAYGIEASDFDDERVHSPAPTDTYHY